MLFRSANPWSPGALRRALVVAGLLLGFAWQGMAHAGLFDDEEARKAILELRQRVEATRQASDAGLQRLGDAHRQLLDSQAEALRRSTEESTLLRRSLLDFKTR